MDVLFGIPHCWGVILESSPIPILQSPYPNPHTKIPIPQLIYVIWNENKWRVIDILIYLKHSTEQNGHFIKLWNLNWKGVDRDRLLKLLSLNWTADVSWYTADKILSSDWWVSLKLCSDWLVNLLKEEFQKWRHTDRQTDTQVNLISCWTAYFRS